MLKISVVYFMWNPEICQDPPTWGQDDLVLLLGFLLSGAKCFGHCNKKKTYMLKACKKKCPILVTFESLRVDRVCRFFLMIHGARGL